MSGSGIGYSVELGKISRGNSGKGSSNVVAKASYDARAALTCPRTHELFDYTHLNPCAATFIYLPKCAPAAWQSVTGQEAIGLVAGQMELRDTKRNAQPAWTAMTALPRGLSPRHEELLMRNIGEKLGKYRGPSSGARTADGKGDNAILGALHREPGNSHCHWIISSRVVTAEGFGQKNRVLKDPAFLKFLRKTIASESAKMLRREANETTDPKQRVELLISADRWEYGHETLPRQGLAAYRRGDFRYAEYCSDHKSEKHMGPIVAAMEKRGANTLLGITNSQIRFDNIKAEMARKEASSRSTSNSESSTVADVDGPHLDEASANSNRRAFAPVPTEGENHLDDSEEESGEPNNQDTSDLRSGGTPAPEMDPPADANEEAMGIEDGSDDRDDAEQNLDNYLDTFDYRDHVDPTEVPGKFYQPASLSCHEHALREIMAHSGRFDRPRFDPPELTSAERYALFAALRCRESVLDASSTIDDELAYLGVHYENVEPAIAALRAEYGYRIDRARDYDERMNLMCEMFWKVQRVIDEKYVRDRNEQTRRDIDKRNSIEDRFQRRNRASSARQSASRPGHNEMDS